MADVQFDEATHTYRVDGQVVPSVTQIIRFLNYDTASTARSWLRDVAADRGTRVHQYCMLHDFGELPPLNEIDQDCVGYVKAYQSFFCDYIPMWEMIEQPLGSLDLGFAGTPDRYGVISGDNCIVDIKTGASVNSMAVAAQLVGYDFLINAPYQLKHFSLHLCKDGTYKFKQHEHRHELFKSCLILHTALEKGKKHG